MAARIGVDVRRLWRAVACLAVLAGGGARAETALSSGLKLSLEERFDDGVLLFPDAAGGDQLMTRVSPELSLGARSPTFSLSGAYAPNLLMRHGSGTTSLDHRLDVDVSQRLSRTFRVGGGAEVWRVSDPTSLPRLGVARARVPVLYGRGDAWGQVALSRRWMLRGSYRFEGAHIQEPGRVPGYMHQPGAELTYRLTPRATLGAEYRFQSLLLGADTAAAHHAGAVASYRLSRLVRLDARGGPVWFRDGAGAQELLPRLQLGLAGESRRFDWGVALGHDLVGASGFNTALWADFASAVAGWALTPSFRLNAAANYFRNGRAPNVGFLDGTGDVQGYALTAGMEWMVHRSFALRGSVMRVQQVGIEDAVAAGALTHNIVSVRAVLTAWE